MADQDTITLAGQELLVRGPVIGKPVAEFTSGIKIGAATYDDRQHAFYAVLDDFSGGFAHRVLDVREALGTHWDNPGGVDVRRARHITLPPKRYVVPVDNNPANLLLSSMIMHLAAIGVPGSNSSESDFYYYGAGDSIYRLAEDRDELERVKLITTASRIPENMSRFLLFRGSDNTRRLYVITINDDLTSRYWYTADPGAVSPTFTEGGKVLWDAIVWDDKIVGQNVGFEFIFTTDGVNWNDDDVNDGQPIWRPHSVCRFLGIALAPWGSNSVVYFLDLGDGRLYVLDFYIRKAYPIDIGDFHYLLTGTVWQGQIALTDGWSVWLYNPGGGAEIVRKIGLFGKDGIPPTLRDGRYRISGLIDGGDLLFAIAEYSLDDKGTTLGFMVLVYNGTGWSLFHPAIEAAQASTTLSVNPMSAIVDRYPVGVISANNLAKETTRALNVFCQSDPDASGAGPYPVRLHSFRLPRLGQIPIESVDEFEQTGTGNHYVMTGWFDGGFADIEGVLHYAKLDLQNASTPVSVVIQYQLDDDEDAAWQSLGTATARGSTTMQFDPTNKAGVQFRTVRFRFGFNRTSSAPTLTGNMTDSQNTVPVSNLAAFPESGIVGITTSGATEYITYTGRSASSGAGNLTGASRGVRGSVAAAHNSGDTVDAINRTVEMRAFTVVFGKKAPLRQSWVAQIDVNRMIERGVLVDTDDDGTPDAAATYQNVWEFLKTIWDKQTLVQLEVPLAEPGANNLRVQIADMPVTQHDARDADTVHGTIDVTFIEPVRADA